MTGLKEIQLKFQTLSLYNSSDTRSAVAQLGFIEDKDTFRRKAQDEPDF
jgi:hypothetical protein